ncbi:hypothetical protein FACS189468_6830 [Spirochaetia bacterium]|nr:hypothetical protein FACS189468_6830 [Spirochaetia bacterium]
MKYSCLHTHTSFCDGQDDVETMCRSAWEKGLESLGFSSHAPITGKTGIPSDWHLREDRLPEYIREVEAARRRWEGKLPVYLGLEVDWIEDLMGPADRDLQDLGLDFIIGSVHYISSPKNGEYFAVDGSAREFETLLREHFDGDGEALMCTGGTGESWAFNADPGFTVLRSLEARHK